MWVLVLVMTLVERFRKRADTDTDTDMITVSVHASHILDFVSQTIGMSALTFTMTVFLTNMTDSSLEINR